MMGGGLTFALTNPVEESGNGKKTNGYEIRENWKNSLKRCLKKSQSGKLGKFTKNVSKKKVAMKVKKNTQKKTERLLEPRPLRGSWLKKQKTSGY
jgi:hypothetical protein